jgi:hypothetical protein
MLGLNFKIKGDDSEIKKTLIGIDKLAKDNAAKLSKELSKTIDKQNDALKVTLKHQKAAEGVVKATEDEAKATDKVTEAIKRKNAAFDDNSKQIRPVQISNSQSEIDAANASKAGTIPSGPVVGSAAEWNKLSNEAAAYGNTAKEAYNKAVTGSNQSTQAVQNAQKAIRSLKIDLQAYRNIAESSTDSKRLGEYNNKVRETQAEIARLRNVGKVGFDELGNKLTVTAGKQEILTQKLRMYQDALSKAKAPQSFIDLNRKIESTEIQLGQLKNAGRKGFDEMGNAVAKSTKGVGAMWQGLKTVANILPGVGIAGLLAFAVEPIMDYIKNLDIFKKKASDIAKEAGTSSSEYKEALTNVASLRTSIDGFHNGTITGKRLVDQYNETIGKTAGLLKTTAEVEDAYTNRSGTYIEGVRLRAEANAALQTSIDLITESQKRLIGGPSLEDYARAIGKAFVPGNTSLEMIKANALVYQNEGYAGSIAKTNEATALLDKLQKKSDEFNKKNGLNFNTTTNGNGAKEAARILEQQRALQQKIDDINKEYTRKSLTKDQEELQAVRDKFKKIADEAARFNANPKNRLNLVDTSKLTQTRDNAIEDLTYRQNTEKLKLGLDKQKVLYADFEDYRTKLGTDAASDRFSAEMNVTTSYLGLLQDRIKEIQSIAPEKRTGAQSERLEFLLIEAKKEEEVEKKKYDNLVKEFIAYSDKRKALIEKYQSDVAQMEARGNDTTALTEKYNADLASLDDANVQKLDAYKNLFKGIENLSDANAKKVLENAQNMLKTLVGEGKISKEMAEQIGKMIQQTNVALKDRMPDRLISLANQIDAVADAVSGVDEGFAKMLGTLGNVVGQVGNIKKGIIDMKAAQGQGDVLGQLGAGLGIFGAGLGIFGAGVSILTSVSKLFDKSAQREEQAAYSRELQNKQTEAMNKALERQIELIDEAYGTERITKYAAAIAQARSDQEKYQDLLQGRYSKTGNKFVDDIFEKANAGDKNALGGIKNLEDLKNFKLPSDIKELERLLNEKKLDAGTEIIVANLIQAAEAAKELQNNLTAENIGTSLDSIADSFVDALTDGTKDFGKTFEDIIKTSILNGFKGRLIEKSLQPFYDQYAEFAEGGLTKEEIETLTKLKDQIIADGTRELENLEQITGVDLRSNDPGSSALQRGITAITQDQASALEGITRGQYELLKQLNQLQATENSTALQGLELSMKHLDAALETAANTFRTANNTDRLAAIESSLGAIAKNTGGSSFSMRGSGFGGQDWQALSG